MSTAESPPRSNAAIGTTTLSAHVRVLEVGSVTLTSRTAAQLDRVAFSDLAEVIGRVAIQDLRQAGATKLTDFFVGSDTSGALVLAPIARTGPYEIPRSVTLNIPGDAAKPKLGCNRGAAAQVRIFPTVQAEFEGRTCFVSVSEVDLIDDETMPVGVLDANGNEESFRDQIRQQDHHTHAYNAALRAPRILLPEA